MRPRLGVNRAKNRYCPRGLIMSFEDDLRRVEEHVAEARRLVQRDSCFLYGVSGIFKDWVATTNLTDDNGNVVLPKSFHEDYPTATLLDDALTFLSNESAIS